MIFVSPHPKYYFFLITFSFLLTSTIGRCSCSVADCPCLFTIPHLHPVYIHNGGDDGAVNKWDITVFRDRIAGNILHICLHENIHYICMFNRHVTI